MKKVIFKKVFIYFIGLVAIILILSFLFKCIKNYFDISDLLIPQIIARIILSLIVIYLIIKEKIIIKKYVLKNKIIHFCIGALLIYSAFGSSDNFVFYGNLAMHAHNNILFMTDCFAIGLFEELFFRVLLFSYVCYLFKDSNKVKLILPILVTSFLFAIIHFVNAMKTDLDAVLTQVVFAFFTGIFLQIIFLRFNNLLLVISIHCCIDYLSSIEQKNTTVSHTGNSPVFVLLLVVFSVFLIYYLYKFIKRENNPLVRYDYID